MDKQLKFKEEFQHPKIHVFKISSHFVAVCLKLQVSKFIQDINTLCSSLLKATSIKTICYTCKSRTHLTLSVHQEMLQPTQSLEECQTRTSTYELSNSIIQHDRGRVENNNMSCR